MHSRTRSGPLHGFIRGTLFGLFQILEKRQVKKILQGHGSGGKLMNEMISATIVRKLGDSSIQLDDSAVFTINGNTLAFTTDTFTITPVFFPGGDIGKLAVNGTVNDLAVMGARPLVISCSLILEEGLEFSLLEKILDSM